MLQSFYFALNGALIYALHKIETVMNTILWVCLITHIARSSRLFRCFIAAMWSRLGS